jgi:pyruvate dehydrogenase E2 component (dihydrolipoamide acetyltransferase)
MPSLGADMEAGTLVEWVEQPGDVLKRGDVIAVVDTQKGAIEIEVFEDGVLDAVAVQPGTRVPVGTVLATIRAGSAGAPRSGQPPRAAPPGPLHASPAARRRARELGVDLAGVTGTGPHGAITTQDVERARTVAAPPAGPPPPAPAPGPGERTSAMRAAIGAAMARSKREIPHYYLSTTIDMKAATEWLRAENLKRPLPERLLVVALLVKAVSLALREVPELNGYWVDGSFRPGTGIHVGCAIALRGGGLVAPAVHDVDRKEVGTLMRDIRDLVARARSGSLKSSELSDATITVTSLGEQGADATFGIIYPPQVALVGFGRVADRPTVVAGTLEVRPTMTATLSGDHRATDGHRGGIFLTMLDRLLQSPEHL